MHAHRNRTTAHTVFALLLGLGSTLPADALAAPSTATRPDSAAAPSKFFSVEDGMLDISTFMDGRYGFMPIVFPVTEPAVGYGAGVMLGFVDKPLGNTRAGFGRPNITMLGGMATENGSWVTMLADVRYWRDDRLKTLVAGVFGSVNLDFGGNGTETSGDRPLQGYNMAPRFLTLQGMGRLGATRMWAGLRYAFATTDVEFASAAPGVPGAQGVSNVGSLAPSLIYDSRDNNFTPESGSYAEVYGGAYRRWLGSDEEFQNAELIAIHYRPLARRLYLGVRADAKSTSPEAPFYVLPYVEMRGVPSLRYQGEVVAQGELELRWQCLGRWSLVGFGGLGSAATRARALGGARTVHAGGAGFRYELARSYEIHAGIDLAWGPDETAIYFQTGSAWGRP
jgi:hypothetical protein